MSFFLVKFSDFIYKWWFPRSKSFGLFLKLATCFFLFTKSLTFDSISSGTQPLFSLQLICLLLSHFPQKKRYLEPITQNLRADDSIHLLLFQKIRFLVLFSFRAQNFQNIALSDYFKEKKTIEEWTKRMSNPRDYYTLRGASLPLNKIKYIAV